MMTATAMARSRRRIRRAALMRVNSTKLTAGPPGLCRFFEWFGMFFAGASGEHQHGMSDSTRWPWRRVSALAALVAGVAAGATSLAQSPGTSGDKWWTGYGG